MPRVKDGGNRETAFLSLLPFNKNHAISHLRGSDLWTCIINIISNITYVCTFFFDDISTLDSFLKTNMVATCGSIEVTCRDSSCQSTLHRMSYQLCTKYNVWTSEHMFVRHFNTPELWVWHLSGLDAKMARIQWSLAKAPSVLR